VDGKVSAFENNERGSTPAPAAQTAQTGVLIVDDQAPFRSAARTLIGLLRGWTVLAEAETGEEGVRMAAELRPHVVLMDINLPGRNGIQSTQDLLAVHPGAAVVLVSTYAAADLPEGADTCGAVGYLRKEELTPRILRELTGRPSGTSAQPTAASAGIAIRPRTDVPSPSAEIT
jgi:CheY-like chemotaxis protein